MPTLSTIKSRLQYFNDPLPAVGGTVTFDGNYIYHTFTGSGTFQVTKTAGLNLDVMMVSGGGAGGWQYFNDAPAGGGGGAGGVIISTGLTKALGSYNVVIGAGGAARLNDHLQGPQNGQNTSFDDLFSLGGGRGAHGPNNLSVNYAVAASSGGSGGGGAEIGTPGTGSIGQGNDGGSGLFTFAPDGGGGGGGYSANGYAVGFTSLGYGNRSSGGSGGSSTLQAWNSATYVAGGGGGGSNNNTNVGGDITVNPPLGGQGGGGTGAYNENSATPGTPNTGGGGGGSGFYYLNSTAYVSAPSNGGSGLVVIRYLRSQI